MTPTRSGDIFFTLTLLPDDFRRQLLLLPSSCPVLSLDLGNV